MSETRKPCTQCHEVKPLEEFNRHNLGRYGRASACKACSRAKQAKYRSANPDKVAENQKRWRENNPESWAKYQREQREQRQQRKAETSASATNKGKPWTDEDYALLLRRDLSLKEISIRLGRTYSSVSMMRSVHIEHLKRQGVIADVQRRMAS